MTNAKQFDREKSRRMITVFVLFFIFMSVVIPAGTQNVYAADGTIQLKVGRVIDYAKYITHRAMMFSGSLCPPRESHSM